MNIAFHSSQFSIDTWQEAFDKVCTGVCLHAIQKCDDLVGLDTEVLLVWKPTITDWRSVETLRHVIYLGASIDAQTTLQLPPQTLTHRLHDAGMKTAMCDYAEYAVLHYHRRFDLFLQAQKEQHWVTERDYKQRQDINVSVLGLGSLGGAVAQHLQRVGYAVSGWSRTQKNMAGINTYYHIDTLNECLSQCDIVINMLPHTPATHHLLNHSRLAVLPKNAALISLSRGATIDTSALIQHLDSGHLRGAFLDVFEQEPLSKDSALWAHPKVTLTPHQSAPTQVVEAAKEIAVLLNKYS
jgi:glyoxylate/hydroxypyruvate reductase A